MEELGQELARSGSVPPVVTDSLDQVAPELRRADPRAKVVGRVEPGVHVAQVGVAPVADAGRLRQVLLVAVRRPAVLAEARPEVELEPQLRLVAPEEQRFEEDGRLGVLARLLVREAEVARVPPRLARDRLADVRIDLS